MLFPCRFHLTVELRFDWCRSRARGQTVRAHSQGLIAEVQTIYLGKKGEYRIPLFTLRFLLGAVFGLL